MAKLVITLDGAQVGEVPIEKERITIGRRAENDIQLDHIAVSGQHAAVVTILNDSFLEDLGSTNGTLVNGDAIRKRFLRDGDLIEIGRHRLRFVGDVVTTREAADFEKTMVLNRPGSAVGVHAATAPEPVARAPLPVESGLEPPTHAAGLFGAGLEPAVRKPEPLVSLPESAASLPEPAASLPEPAASPPEPAAAPAPLAPRARRAQRSCLGAGHQPERCPGAAAGSQR